MVRRSDAIRRRARHGALPRASQRIINSRNIAAKSRKVPHTDVPCHDPVTPSDGDTAKVPQGMLASGRRSLIVLALSRG